MFDITSLAVDAKKAKEGVWVEYPGGAKFKVARYSSPDADMARREVQLKHYNQLQETLKKGEEVKESDEYMQDMAHVVAEHILVDWDNISEKGKKLPYSVEKAAELLSHPNYYELYKFVIEQSLSQENFAIPVEEVAEDVKSSAEA